MNNLWLKIRVWTKVVIFALLLIYALVFIWKNSGRDVHPWFWYKTEPLTSVLTLVTAAFLIGVVATILIGTTFRTLRQIRELRTRSRSEQLEREMAEMKAKASMLRPRGAEGGVGVAEEPLDSP